MRYFNGGPFFFIVDEEYVYSVEGKIIIQSETRENFLNNKFWQDREIKEKTAILHYSDLIMKFEEYKNESVRSKL